MKRTSYWAAIAFSIGLVGAGADEQVADEGESAAERATAAELRPLQGTWEQVLREGSLARAVKITIKDDSFRFFRDDDFWFETTIALPAGTEPKQLHATIKNTTKAQAESIGKVVGAIYKIEDDVLTLLAYDIEEDPPEEFEEHTNLYVVKKVKGDEEPEVSEKG